MALHERCIKPVLGTKKERKELGRQGALNGQGILELYRKTGSKGKKKHLDGGKRELVEEQHGGTTFRPCKVVKTPSQGKESLLMGGKPEGWGTSTPFSPGELWEGKTHLTSNKN